MHGVAPPYLHAISHYLIDAGTRGASCNAKAHRNGFELSPPPAFHCNIGLDSRLQTAARRQYEHHAQERGYKQRPGDCAFLNNSRLDGVPDDELVAPLEFVADLLREHIAL